MNVSVCPNPEQLRDYVEGRLDADSHDGIDAHLDTCGGCRQTAERLDGRAATPFPLPSSLPALIPGGDPFLSHLVLRVKSLAVTPGAGSVAPICVSADAFLERLARSGVVTAAELNTAARLSDDNLDAAGLAGRLVERGLLTAWLAEELIRGDADGLVLGSYVLLEPIGAGGMGRVFRARHRRMGRTVALKVLAPELLRSASARARFRREVEAAARLASPHLVTAHDAGESGGRDFLVMEYIEGKTLADLVRQQGPLPVRLALDYTLQAARGLASAHDAGIVHRDVKPSNLMLAHGGVKVLDLGLARLLEGPGTNGATETTSGNAVVGTAAYLAPEQAADPRRAGLHADVYGLGCTLCYLLTGRPPYDGHTAMELVFAHRERPVPSLRVGRPDCPAAVDTLFRRMVAKDPGLRPTDMTAVAAELKRLLADAPRPRRVFRRLAGVGIAAAMVLFAILAFGRPGVPGTSGTTSEPGAESLPALPPGPTPPEIQPRAGKPEVPQPRGPVVEMVMVPVGPFEMGAPDTDPNAGADEKPRHTVTLTRPFRLGRTEVTQAQYHEVLGNNPSSFGPKGEFASVVARIDTGNHPVDSVRWTDAILFCNRLSERHGLRPYYRIDGERVTVAGGDGYRLPTEAEWEYACRAGTETPWSFGDRAADVDAHAWHAGNSAGRTHPVGTKRPNRLGLHDMYGNVPEWCWDRYGRDYYRRSDVFNPAGPGEGESRVFRGGGWGNRAAQLRSASRSPLGMAYSLTNPVGFRVARTAAD